MIYKRSVDVAEKVLLEGRPVSFGVQGDDLVVWYLHGASPRMVTVVGTGWEFDDDWCPFASVQVGPFVWHLLYKDPPR